MILLIDNYDSFTYNLYQSIAELGFRCRVVRNDALSLAEIRALKPRAIVLSPAPELQTIRASRSRSSGNSAGRSRSSAYA